MIALFAALLAATPGGDRISLTISGGVSLGSYEAGLTWATVRYLRASRRPAELVAVTGASAGATNALLAAALWCEEPQDSRDEDPDANLFHDLWAPVGFDELLPDDPAGFNPADGILTSTPLERAFERLRANVLASDAHRFRPGCAVSVGLTVTREQPEERMLAGLRARRQRFVVPWRFEVDGAGRARIVSAPLPSDRDSAVEQLLLGEPRGDRGVGALQASQAALASGAFPFAFRPRPLCDCALRCADEDVVRDGVCEGPDPAHPIRQLSCEAVKPAGARQLCRHLYVDGGIFDNAPIGLAVDLAETSGAATLPFQPTVYFFVDPDHRRLAAAANIDGMSGLASSAQLIGNLIGTARETELARAIHDERWQRTTQSTISEFAQLQADVAATQAEMARIAGASGTEPTSAGGALLRSPRREALGSFLMRCLDKLGRPVDPGGIPVLENFAACAQPMRDGTAGAGERAERLSPAAIVGLASGLATILVSSNSTAERVLAEVTAPTTAFDRQLQLLALIHDASTIVAVSYGFLAGEISALAAAELTGAELVQVRRALLTVARFGMRYVNGTSAMLRVLLVASLLEEQMEGTLPAKAAEARRAIASGVDSNLEGASLREMATGSDRIARLVALAPLLRTLSARAAAIAGDATQLSAANAQERQLVVSRRFAPLAASALLNFSGFLDRPLRNLDFYSGVYDSALQIATHECQIQGPYPLGERPAPIFRADAPVEIDPSAEDTQRCIGRALRETVELLSLPRSARASFVVARLARLELTAQLGRAAAARLVAEPAWSWLGESRLPDGDPVGAALAAVTSRASPCRPGATEALCLVDPSLDELLDALEHFGYVASSPSMREALADRDRWAAHLTAKLVDRAAAVEIASSQRARRSPSEIVLTGVGFGEIWARRTRQLSTGPAFDLDPSTLPERSPDGASRWSLVAAHALPYRLSLDVVHGGAAFSWIEPAFRLNRWFSIESIADLLAIDDSGRLQSNVGVLPTFRVRGSFALGVGLRTAIPWNGDPVLVPGLITRIGVFQERLAFTLGVRSLASGHHNVVAEVSLSDLNGLIYWLGLWGVGRK